MELVLVLVQQLFHSILIPELLHFLSNNTGAVSGGVIFGEETSVNWVNIDIQRTRVINASTCWSRSNSWHKIYLYGYTVEASPPTTRVQGFTVGARQDGTGANAIPDKLNCLLVSSGAI